MTLRLDYLLDAADLAGIEISDHATDLERALVAQIRYYREEYASVQRRLRDACDHVKDAEIALGHLTTYLKDVPYEANRYADSIEDDLKGILLIVGDEL